MTTDLAQHDAPPLPTHRLLSMAAAVAGAVGAAVLVDGMRERSDLSSLDPEVATALVRDRTPALTVLADLLSFVGSEVVVGLMALLLVLWLGPVRRQWRLAALVSASMALSAGLTLGLKYALERARPPASMMLGPVDTGYSFPSGHTLNSAVLFGLVAWLCVRTLRSRPARVAVVVSAVLLAAGVGASRLYLGYHWMTDVLGGWSVGVMVLGLAVVAAPTVLDRPLPGRLDRWASRLPDRP